MRRRTAGLVVLILLAVGLAGCGGGSDGGGGGDEAAEAKPEFAVGTRFETFVDTSRPTPPIGDAGKPERTLETFIWYPADGPAGGASASQAPPATARGPFPLVVFSHGSGVSSPVRYELVVNALAAAGYVVAAPKHPLSSTSIPGASADTTSQPGDISFVIDEMLRLNRDRSAPYAGLIDPAYVAVGGHSLGGYTTMGVGYNACCADRRIKAGMVMAGGMNGPFPEDRFFGDIHTPILVVHGDDDRVVRIAEGQRIFSEAPPPKVMLTLFGGDHSRPYGGSLSTTENPERLGATLNGPTRFVNTTAVAFLDRFLKDRNDALQRLEKSLVDEISLKLEVVER